MVVLPTSERVLDATLACIARVGLGKTTLDDVAREAGCSRATLYRSYPGKQPLLAALVAREAARLGEHVVAAASDAADLTDAIVAVMTSGARYLGAHDALRFSAAVEPEQLLPHLAFERANAVLAAASALIAPAFVRFLPPERAERLAEWVARISLSYLCTALPGDDLLDDAKVRELVEDFVLPRPVEVVPVEGVLG